MSLQVLSLQWFGVSSELQTGHREMDKNCRLAPETTSSKAALQHFKDDDGWNMLERVSHSNMHANA